MAGLPLAKPTGTVATEIAEVAAENLRLIPEGEEPRPKIG